MKALLDVRELAPVSGQKMQWLLNMVGDAGIACRFEKGLPGVDLAPLNGINGPYAGVAFENTTRWAVTLSFRSPFWRQSAVVRVYLHECSHLLVFEQSRLKNTWTHSHGPVFLLIQLVLFQRVDQTGQYSFKLMPRVDLYDFADRPFNSNHSMLDWEWRSIVLSFGLKHYQRLAQSEMSAEAVAAEAFDLWVAQLQELEAEKQSKIEQVIEQGRQAEERKTLARERDSLQSQVTELERQRSVSFAWRFLFLTGWPSVIAQGGFALGIFACGVFAVGYGLGLHRVLS